MQGSIWADVKISHHDISPYHAYRGRVSLRVSVFKRVRIRVRVFERVRVRVGVSFLTSAIMKLPKYGF